MKITRTSKAIVSVVAGRTLLPYRNLSLNVTDYWKDVFGRKETFVSNDSDASVSAAVPL